MLREHKLFMKPEGDAAAGGSSAGSSSSLLTPPGSGSPAQGSAGNANPPPGTSAGQPPVPPSNGSNTPGPATTDWRSSLPQELQEDASLKKFTSIPALAGAYLSAQKLIGVDKIPVPGKHTTPEEFRQVLHRLGLPEKIDAYDVKFKPEAKIEEEFSTKFKAAAHGAGLLPQHAQAMADWLADIRQQTVQQFDQAAEARHKATADSLKTEWGQAFNQKVGRANKALLEIGGREAFDHFNSIGLGGDEKFVRFLAAIGDKMFAEHKIVDGDGTPVRTPQELDSAIASLKTSPAFLDKNHPQHSSLIKEYTALFQQRYSVDRK